MNWLPNKNIYIVILLFLTIFSCKRGGELGDEIQPRAEALGTYFTDSLKLKTSIVYYDSMFSNVSNRVLVGYHKDPLFGTIKATPFIGFGKTGIFNTWGPNPIFDSVTVSIFTELNTVSSGLIYYYKSENTASVFLNIHEILQEVDKDSLYTNNKSFSYNPQSLTNIELNQNTKSITKRLPDSFGQKFIDNPNSFSTDADFNILFKGLVLIPATNSNNIVSIYSAIITIHYHNLFAFNNFISPNKFLIVSAFPTIPRSAVLNVEVNRAGTEISPLKQNHDSIQIPFNSGLKCMVQNNTNIFTRVEFPQIYNFIKSVKGKILINRAEIIISPDTSLSDGYLFPQGLYALKQTGDRRVKKDIFGNAQFLQDNLLNVFNNTFENYAFYNNVNNNYTFIITTYMQALIDGKIENNGLLIGAENDIIPMGVSTNIKYNSLKRIIFSNSDQKTNYIKLRVYYTPFN